MCFDVVSVRSVEALKVYVSDFSRSMGIRKWGKIYYEERRLSFRVEDGLTLILIG